MPTTGTASAKTSAGFLRPGERVLWEGRPRRRPIGLAPDERAPAILTLGWFAIASYALLWALDRDLDATWVVLAAGVPTAFLLSNLRRLFSRHRARRGLSYVLTDRRVLWLAGGHVTEELPLAEVTEVSVHHHNARAGTVVLGPTSRAAEVLRRSDARAKGRAILAPALEDLGDAEAVYGLVRGAVGP